MFSAVEIRSVIRFLVLKNYSTANITEELRSVYRDECPSQRTIYSWVAQFKHGRTSVFDEACTGRPTEIPKTKTDELKRIIQSDRRITTRTLADKLNVSKGSLGTLMQNVGVRKLCSRFVPRFLTADMCQTRIQCCTKNLEVYEELGERLIRNIVTMDETPLSLYIPQSKQESREWKFPGEERSRKLRSSAIHRKVLMLTIFWSNEGVVMMDFTEGSCNSAYYIDLLMKARKNKRKPRNEDLWLLQDNAPIHTSSQSTSAIMTTGFNLLAHPPYSPDLAPSDFYLFSHLKKYLRGTQFSNKEELMETVNDFFSSRPTDFFENAFNQLVHRWRKCCEVNGGYIEG